MLTKEEAHLATGMKVSEIVDIKPVDGGYQVTTHDNQVIYLESVDGPVAYGLDPDPARVPMGSEKEVLAWVGTDLERAVAALDDERRRETPRKGLIDKLLKLAD